MRKQLILHSLLELVELGGIRRRAPAADGAVAFRDFWFVAVYVAAGGLGPLLERMQALHRDLTST